MRALALLLALCGCTAQPVHVHLVSELDEVHEAALLLDASDILGLELVATEAITGAIELELRDESGGVRGTAEDKRGCVRFGWSVPDPLVMAHEFGHLLGIDRHHDDPANLMHSSPTGTELDDTQIDTIERGSRQLSRC